MIEPLKYVERHSFTLAAIILALGFVIAAIIGAVTFYQVRALDSSFEVTGSAKQEITSDVVKWRTTFIRLTTINELRSGHQQMGEDLKKVLAFYKEQGFEEAQLTVSPVFQDQDYNAPNDGSAQRRYILRQTIELQSGDVDRITQLAKRIDPLINQGVIFSTTSLEYYYSQLPEVRVNLLSDAVTDARTRAEKIAASGNRGVGSLRAASVGVVQVLPLNSVDISDYGAYDTSEIKKQVMVTVKVTFGLR